MYNNPYDITPHINNPSESKMNRDSIHFPSSLASTSNKPIHQIDYNFNDRQYRTDRRKCSNVTVQNDYLQKYQIHELQQSNFGRNFVEQTNIDRIMEKKIPTDGNQLSRNHDDAIFFGKKNPIIQPNFSIIDAPLDTRREKYDLSMEKREPMSKVLGAPPKYSGSRNL